MSAILQEHFVNLTQILSWSSNETTRYGIKKYLLGLINLKLNWKLFNVKKKERKSVLEMKTIDRAIKLSFSLQGMLCS